MTNLNDNPYQRIDSEAGAEKRVAYLAIGGMGCANCASRIQNALLRVQGISEVIIDHQDGLGQVTYDPQLVSDALLLQTVDEAGNDGHHHYAAQVIELGN